jgi:hypothetical protein
MAPRAVRARADACTALQRWLQQGLSSWTGAWTDVREIPVPSVQSGQVTRGICAGQARAAAERASHNLPVAGSSPARPTYGFHGFTGRFVTGSWTDGIAAVQPAAFVLRSHRATAERVGACQGVRRKDRHRKNSQCRVCVHGIHAGLWCSQVHVATERASLTRGYRLTIGGGENLAQSPAICHGYRAQMRTHPQPPQLIANLLDSPRRGPSRSASSYRTADHQNQVTTAHHDDH